MRIVLKIISVFTVVMNMCSCHQNDSVKIIDSYISNLHGKRFFNGAILISDDNQIIYEQGFGLANVDENLAFSKKTAVDAGSITKTVTSTGIFKLIEQKQIQLSDHITKYLPELTYSSIQIHHLLGHSSGIIGDDYFFNKAPNDSIITNDFFLSILAEEKPGLTFEPGSRFEYSNVNYILLAIIIERITKEDYQTFITKNFLDPLGMDHSFLRPSLFKDWTTKRTIGYNFENDTILNDSDNYEGFYGCCNLFFSVQDLHKWNQAFIEKDLLSIESLKTGLKNYRLNDSTTTNLNLLNWYTSENSNEYHFTGDWRGFYAIVYRNISKKRSIVYLTNGSMPNWLKSQLVIDINKILDGYTVKNIEIPNMESINDIDSILGDYEIEESTLSITKDTTNIYIQIGNNNPSYPLYQVGSKMLFCPGMDAWIWFPKANNNSVQELIYSSIHLKAKALKMKDS